MRRTFRFMVVASILSLIPTAMSWADEGRGGHHGLTLVGAWHCQIFDEFDNPIFTGFQVYHSDGITLNTPSVDPDSTAYGTWRKLRGHRYTSAFYFAVIDETTGLQTGNLKIANPITVDDWNHFHGTAEAFFLVGTDPVDPIEVIPLGNPQRQECKRLPR